LAGVEQVFQIGDIAPISRLTRVAIKSGEPHEITEMRLRTMLARDVPATPAIRHRSAVRDVARVGAADHLAAAIGAQGAHEMARHSQGPARDVALETVLAPRKRRLFR